MPHPFAAGENIADRWCSSHCYGVELQEQTMQHVRRQRIGRATSEERVAA